MTEEIEFGPGCRNVEFDAEKLKALKDPVSSTASSSKNGLKTKLSKPRSILPAKSLEPRADLSSTDFEGKAEDAQRDDDLFAEQPIAEQIQRTNGLEKPMRRKL